jgi:hypothetical protein
MGRTGACFQSMLAASWRPCVVVLRDIAALARFLVSADFPIVYGNIWKQSD